MKYFYWVAYSVKEGSDLSIRGLRVELPGRIESEQALHQVMEKLWDAERVTGMRCSGEITIITWTDMTPREQDC